MLCHLVDLAQRAAPTAQKLVRHGFSTADFMRPDPVTYVQSLCGSRFARGRSAVVRTT
jgi:hypothetical protein